jgi:hypothetical protein
MDCIFSKFRDFKIMYKIENRQIEVVVRKCDPMCSRCNAHKEYIIS